MRCLLAHDAKHIYSGCALAFKSQGCAFVTCIRTQTTTTTTTATIASTTKHHAKTTRYISSSIHFTSVLRAKLFVEDGELQRQQKCKRQAKTRSVSVFQHACMYTILCHFFSLWIAFFFILTEIFSSFSFSILHSRLNCCINFLCYCLSCCCKTLFDFCACSPICFDGTFFSSSFHLPRWRFLWLWNLRQIDMASDTTNVEAVMKIYMPIWRRRRR